MKRTLKRKPNSSGAGWFTAGAVALLGGAAIAIKDQAINGLQKISNDHMEFALRKCVESTLKDKQIEGLQIRQLEDQATIAELRRQNSALKARAERAEGGERFQRAVAEKARRESVQLKVRIIGLEMENRDLTRDGDAGPVSG